jgi:putative ABC transport system ATP-binding protein
VTKVHGKGEGAVVALDEVSVTLPFGSFTTIMGPSGSGKSTFLHVAAGLDRPDEGAVTFGDTELTRLSERRLTILRRERIGFVFQAFNLMPSLTVAQNIGLPLRLDGRNDRGPRSQPPAEEAAHVDDVRSRLGACDDRPERHEHAPTRDNGDEDLHCHLARVRYPAQARKRTDPHRPAVKAFQPNERTTTFDSASRSPRTCAPRRFTDHRD